MSELDNLRPEVREAVVAIDGGNGVFVNSDDGIGSEKWKVVRAELLRLAGECAMIPRAQLLANFAAANERAEKAEAELATAQDIIDAQQDTMGAVKLKLAIAEAELAALKARMFQGIVLDVDDLARGHAGLPSEWRGKRVRLVVEE